jgi:choline dehydrogenase-like flavoprotein
MWGELGNKGWSWDALAPYFEKSHTLVVPKDPAVHEHFHLDYINPNFSGKEGPIKASFPSGTDNPLPDAWIKTLQALGHKATGDPFSGEIVGAYTNAASIDPETCQRSYAASAYLDPIRDRMNLTVVTGAYVQKLELAGAHPEVRCEGVRYLYNGETKTAKVTSEVILAAGALHTP